MLLPENSMLMLLKELAEFFEEIAPEMDRVWRQQDSSVAIPAHELHFAENRFATWNNIDEFWDTQELHYLNPLPSPPRWRTSLHLCGLYFYFQQSREGKDANQAERNTSQARG